MRTSRFSAEQIIRIIGEHVEGTCADDVCRQHGISRATLYRWKQQSSGMAVRELQRLTALEAENARLTRLVVAICPQAMLCEQALADGAAGYTASVSVTPAWL
jgi:putative transposase